MRVSKFGLSTIPVTQAKSALLLQIERDLLALVYRDPRELTLSPQNTP